MPKIMDRNSRDDILIPVEVVVPIGANPNVEADVVSFQFTPGGLPPRSQPTSGGWLPGYWNPLMDGRLAAAITVGPGGAVTLTPGRWTVWIKVSDNPTAPVEAVDVLTIT